MLPALTLLNGLPAICASRGRAIPYERRPLIRPRSARPPSTGWGEEDAAARPAISSPQRGEGGEGESPSRVRGQERSANTPYAIALPQGGRSAVIFAFANFTLAGDLHEMCVRRNCDSGCSLPKGVPPLACRTRPFAMAPGVRHSKSQIVGFSSPSATTPHPPQGGRSSLHCDHRQSTTLQEMRRGCCKGDLPP